LRLTELLRTMISTVAATATGALNVAVRRDGGKRIELKRGDAAPLFELPGSDGRTYRLADMIGRHAVVIAWFPKAFTAG
jgi:hypothetical protein